jgi:hypothetical protein
MAGPALKILGIGSEAPVVTRDQVRPPSLIRISALPNVSGWRSLNRLSWVIVSGISLPLDEPRRLE